MTNPLGNATDTQRPLGELIGDITDDLSRLFRQEVELAKAEAVQEGKKAALAAGAFAAAGIAGVLVAVLLSFAAVYALAELMHIGWAAVIIALVWAVAAAALQAAGRRRMHSVAPLPQTTETLKENAKWLKNPTR